MTTSGLVLTLDSSADRQARTIEQLSSDARITVGQLIDCRLPIVMETDGAREASDLAEGLLNVPGIVFVDVIYVDFSEEG